LEIDPNLEKAKDLLKKIMEK